MYVCVCKGVTDKQIKREMEAGAGTFTEIQERLEVATCCGQCRDYARETMENIVASRLAVAV